MTTVNLRLTGRSCAMAVALCLLAWATAGAAGDIGSPENSWRETVRAFALEHFKQPAWGYSHSVRDYELARRLAASDHVVLDDDVLYAAAYLHDMAAFPPWAKPPPADHADVAADTVESILKGTGFPMSKTAKVQAAIRTHMYDRDPVGPEALYLHDADALDWLGAIGAARILALVDPLGGKPQTPDVVPMLEDNLAKVPPRIISAAGRDLAVIRKEELATFLRQLRQETDDLHSL